MKTNRDNVREKKLRSRVSYYSNLSCKNYFFLNVYQKICICPDPANITSSMHVQKDHLSLCFWYSYSTNDAHMREGAH